MFLSKLLNSLKNSLIGFYFGFALVYLLFELYKNGDFFIKPRIVALIFIIFLFSVGTYSYATATRISRSINNDLTGDEIANYLSINANTVEFVSGLIVKRFSLIDYSYSISNSFYIKYLLNQNLNFLEFFKSTVNITFPATIFENTLTSNTYLRSLNEDLSKEELLNDWSSYNATFYDFNFLYFNYFSLIISFILFWVYLKYLRMINKIFPSFFYFFTLQQISSFFVFFGYDYFIKSLVHGYLTLSVLALLLSLTSMNKRIIT